MKLYFIAVVAIISVSEHAYSWSADGHEVTAMIALKYLDENNKPQVAAKVRAVTQQIVNTYYSDPAEKKALLYCPAGAGQAECNTYISIAAASIFPDRVKHAPDGIFLPTASWHFINTDNQTYDLNEGMVPTTDEYTKKHEVVGDLYNMISTFTNYLKTLNSKGKGELGPRGAKIPAAVDWAAQCSKRAYGCETEALSFLIHFVGDIHQPLHVSSACDEGGNKEIIKLFGQTGNPKFIDKETHQPEKYELHAAWDEDLLTTSPDPSGKGGSNVSKRINDMNLMAQSIREGSTSDMRTWSSQIDPKVWADESLGYAPQVYDFSFDNQAQTSIARRKVAQAGKFRCPSTPPVPVVGVNYQKNALPIINRRLHQGGLRLAALLDFIYGQGK